MAGLGRLEPTDRVRANGWNRRLSPVAVRSDDRLLSEPSADTQPWRRELVFMPPKPPFQRRGPKAQKDEFADLPYPNPMPNGAGAVPVPNVAAVAGAIGAGRTDSPPLRLPSKLFVFSACAGFVGSQQEGR